MPLLRLINRPRARREQFPDRVVPLTEADISSLRIGSHARVSLEEARDSLQTMPDLSYWHPASGEFVLVAPWRHRSDILTFRMLGAFGHEHELVDAALLAADARGMAAFVTAETYERRRPTFYARHELELLEVIISYNHPRIEDFLDVDFQPVQEFRPVHIEDNDLLEGVMNVDHTAFSWMWRNSAEEFLWWIQQPSVEVAAGMIDGKVVSYYGCTYFRNMGHLDRIGVRADFQSRGLGSETLTASLQRMARLGLKRAALSTQQVNDASQKMYERAGFRRMPQDDYHMYGTLLTAAPGEALTE